MPYAQFVLGDVLLRTGRFTEAADHLHSALALDPNFTAAKNDLEQLQRESKK